MERGKDSEHSKSLKSSPGSAINREPQILPESYKAEASVVSFPFPSWPAHFLFSLSPASLRHKEASVELGESCIELCLPRRMLQVMYRSNSGVEQANLSQYSWHSKSAHKMQWLQSKTLCNQHEKERKTVFVFSIVNWDEFSIERFHSCGQHLCKVIGTRESVYIRKKFNPTGLVWNTNMTAISLFWNTNIAAVTSYEYASLD